MAIKTVKKAQKSPATGEDDTRGIVQTMLREIEQGGEARVREYARQLDGWERDIIVSRAQIEAAGASLSARMREDIRFSHARVRGFAEAQLASMSEFETVLTVSSNHCVRFIAALKIEQDKTGQIMCYKCGQFICS